MWRKHLSSASETGALNVQLESRPTPLRYPLSSFLSVLGLPKMQVRGCERGDSNSHVLADTRT
jgi:hypothetical protein